MPKHATENWLRRPTTRLGYKQSLIVEAIQIARSLYARGRNPFADRHYANTPVANSVGFDLDVPTMPPEENGSIRRPPSGGLRRPA
eukprot:1886225-Pyramimonas_sp.AAC.1